MEPGDSRFAGQARSVFDYVPEAASRIVSSVPRRRLWPRRFRRATDRTAYEFLLELRTWNEAEGAIQPFPDREYLWEYVREWWNAWSVGRTLCVEKCRRMVISWAARGLELFVMGLSRIDGLIGGEDYEASAKHCWLYRHL